MESSNHLRALAHPVRLRILSLLTGADLTAADVARELGITHANASYHLRFLLDAGEIVVSGEESIRGGRARRYRHHWREEDRPPTGGVADPEAATMVVRAAVDELQRRHRSRRRGEPGLVTDAELWVEVATWERARALLEEASALLHDGARPPRTEGTELVNLSLFAFVMDAR
jgi:DNA-binding transcriptional ArsR family regulator